jgi:hypothetical protein
VVTGMSFFQFSLLARRTVGRHAARRRHILESTSNFWRTRRARGTRYSIQKR